MDMKYLSDKYVSVYTYKGFDICTLKVASPLEGDELGYLVDSTQFIGKVYSNVDDAMSAIDLITI